MTIKHFMTIRDLVREADLNGLLQEVPGLSGFSGEKVVGALQRIAKYQHGIGEGAYLEVGVFQGMSLISVAAALDGAAAYGIDNFSQFDPYAINRKIVDERARSNNLANVQLVDCGFEEALANFTKRIGDLKIGTCFIDGPHDYRSQMLCLLLAKPHLSNLAVIVVDDCNFQHVRQANRDFLLTNPDFRLIFEAYTPCHPRNMSGKAEREARKGWWNGVNIMVHDPESVLNRMQPETATDTLLFANDHIVHGAKYGFLAPDILTAIRLLFSFRLVGACGMMIDLGRKAWKERALKGRYPSMNTWSEKLPRTRFNSTLH